MASPFAMLSAAREMRKEVARVDLMGNVACIMPIKTCACGPVLALICLRAIAERPRMAHILDVLHIAPKDICVARIAL